MPVDATLATFYRTHTCGALRADDAGADAQLAGWVHRRRDYGKLLFIDLRDRHGITQVVVDAADAPEAHEVASRVRSEWGIWYWISGCFRWAAVARSPCVTACPAVLPKTRPSSSELLPSLLAPCSPVEAISPHA